MHDGGDADDAIDLRQPSVALTGTFGPFHDMIIGPEIGTPLATSRSVQPGRPCSPSKA